MYKVTTFKKEDSVYSKGYLYRNFKIVKDGYCFMIVNYMANHGNFPKGCRPMEMNKTLKGICKRIDEILDENSVKFMKEISNVKY